MFNTNQKMKSSHLWEKNGTRHACRLCGQYIQNEEEYRLMFVPTEFRRMESNFLVHTHEWNSFMEGKDESPELTEDIVLRLSKTKQPRTKNATKPDEQVVEAFKRVLSKKGYRIKKETANRIYFKTNKNTAQFIFDKRFRELDSTGRNNGMFDSLFLREFYSRMREDLEKELGQESKKGFRVLDAIDEATKVVDDLMK